MNIRMALVAGAAALAGIAAPLALGQEQTINDYVRSLIADYADPDERLVDIQLDELEQHDTAEYIFDIDPDKTYFVYGACDDDCYDIDLEAHTEEEDTVSIDDEDDA